MPAFLEPEPLALAGMAVTAALCAAIRLGLLQPRARRKVEATPGSTG